MRRRREDQEDAPLVRARAERLFQAPAGWVPEPVELDRPERSWSPADGRPRSPADGWSREGSANRWGVEEPGEPDLDIDSAGPATAQRSGRLDGADPGEQPGKPRSRAAALRASWLPETVRGGRLDPGRHGAMALLLVGLLAALVAGGVVLRGRPQQVPAPPAVEVAGEPLPGAAAGGATSGTTPGAPAGEVVVAVAGKVASPGLVRLPAGSRVDDAVRAAGGPLPGTDLGLLNLARKVQDGEQVLVGVDVPAGSAAAAGGSGSAGGLVDLNAATAADFDTLPGIGPVLAERIVAWREENGPFRSVEQLREVPGIGSSKYATLESKVVV